MKYTGFNSRRNFIQQAGLTTLGLTGLSLLPLSCTSVWDEKNRTSQVDNRPSSAVAVRKNIADLGLDDPEIQLLKDAINILKRRSDISPLDPMGWQAHGMLHATFCATSIYANQVHYNWYVWLLPFIFAHALPGAWEVFTRS